MANFVALFWRISYVVTHTLAGAAERLHRSPLCGIRFLFRIDKSGQKVCGIRGGKMRREYAKWKSSREIRRIIIRNSMSGRREQDVPFNHPQAIGKFHSNPHPWGQRENWKKSGPSASNTWLNLEHVSIGSTRKWFFRRRPRSSWYHLRMGRSPSKVQLSKNKLVLLASFLKKKKRKKVGKLSDGSIQVKRRSR